MLRPHLQAPAQTQEETTGSKHGPCHHQGELTPQVSLLVCLGRREEAPGQALESFNDLVWESWDQRNAYQLEHIRL